MKNKIETSIFDSTKCIVCINHRCKECSRGEISLPFDEDHFIPDRKEKNGCKYWTVGNKVVFALNKKNAIRKANKVLS